MKSINLPSAEIVEDYAFGSCEALAAVKFGNELESVHSRAFSECDSLERMTIPLKENIFDADDVFSGCVALKHVDLVERAALQETIAALHFDSWRNSMNREIDSIHQILPITNAGNVGVLPMVGGKVPAIERWIRTILIKIAHYKGEHLRVLNEASTTLQYALPRDIVTNSVIPFLALPPHTFEDEYEEYSEGEEAEDNEDEDELEEEYSEWEESEDSEDELEGEYSEGEEAEDDEYSNGNEVEGM